MPPGKPAPAEFAGRVPDLAVSGLESYGAEIA
jgi:hypothetical protein